MKMRKMKVVLAVLCTLSILVTSFGMVSAAPEDYTYYSGVKFVENSNGLKLGYHKDSGVTIIKDQASGYSFKDLNKNGQLDPYEDWRLSSTDRAKNLVSLMTLDKKLALKSHGGINATTGLRFAVQRGSGKSTMAEDNNNVQMQCEGSEWGIPAVRSSDPRHTGTIDAGFFDGNDLTISRWPSTMALSNSMDPEMFAEYGKIVAAEYRAIGIQMQLGPQFDQITDPRWGRNNGCVTEDYKLQEDLIGAMIESMQTTETSIKDYGIDKGWGFNSLAAMAKHYPSSGAGEFGFEGHTDLGKFNVYPGGGFQKMMDSFSEAAGFKPEYKNTTRQASSVMPMYSINYDQYPDGTNMGGAFSKWLLTDMLRNASQYDGMVCTDWGIQANMAWGVENAKGYTDVYRLLISYLAGVDQQGGYGNLANIRAAYDMGINGNATFGVPAYGETYMNKVVDDSCVRILRVIFNLGLFENPYADPDYANSFVGSHELSSIAYEGHLESVALLKNSNNVLPIKDATATAYTPQLKTVSGSNTTYSFPLTTSVLEDFYDVPAEITGITGNTTAMTAAEKQAAADAADFAIVWLEGPKNGNGTNNLAQTCQFGPYVSNDREVSIGADWYHADGTIVQFNETPNPSAGDYKRNRSIRGWTNPGSPNKLEMLQETVELMKGKPIIAILNYNQPTVPAEFEPYVDAIVASSSCTPQAYLSAINGDYEPTGLLAVTMPASMAAIENSCEDIPDTPPYVDADGNTYAFGYGLNYSGRIVDDRTADYVGLEMISAPETAVINTNFEVKISLPKGSGSPKLVNENGGLISLKSAVLDNSGDADLWTLTTQVGTDGKRTIRVVTQNALGTYATSLKFTINVTKSTTAPAVQKVTPPASMKVNVAANFAIQTNDEGSYSVNIKAKGAASYLGKSVISKTKNADGTYTWVIAIKIGSAGKRDLEVYAGDKVGNLSAPYAVQQTVTLI